MDSQNDLQNLLNAHREWLLIDAAGRSFALSASEIEITFERGRTLLGFLDDRGFQTWRVADFQTKGAEIRLDLTRGFERERAKIRLVPRARAKDLSAALETARLEKANQLARLIAERMTGAKLVRIALNKENGRLAQIVFADSRKKQIAALSDVSAALSPEKLLAAAIFRLVKLRRRRKNPIETVWILAEKAAAAKLRRLHALLRPDWQTLIIIKEISRAAAESQSAEAVKDLPPMKIADLWRGGRHEHRKTAKSVARSAAASAIRAASPEETDAIFSRGGETLRFRGLAFARIRKVFEKEQVWFGVERARQLLSEKNQNDFADLLENLRKFRRHDAPNKRHLFYRLAPEAWLESILRRDVRKLDANLVLSPLYEQFRAGRERVDLLALRRDGRLVIIELKTAPDREAALQIADYWRRIERLRRRGDLQKTRLFGDLEIADAPAICYLVAPTLSFHRDTDFLAAALAPEIEIYRFHLAENWRERLKVIERRAAGKAAPFH